MTTKTPREVIAHGLVLNARRGMPRLFREEREADDIRMFLDNGEADAILSALSSAGYTVEQGWQPIETAPKDGTPIEVLHGTLRTRGQVFCCPVVVVWAKCPHLGSLIGEGWRAIDNPQGALNPKVWRPLPAPPAEKAAG